MIQILTPTGARPEAWALCCEYMARQTYSGPVRWVIVDDGPVAQEIPEPRAGWEIEVIRPKTLWRPGKNTQIANLRLGIAAISDAHPLVFIEDDEHYTADYLERVATELRNHDLVGQKLCRKYNLRTRRAKEVIHPWCASLCATAVKGGALKKFRDIIRAGPLLVDGVLWRSKGGHLFDGAYVTGIKCMPGRGGIDSGHRPDFGDIRDPDLTLLRQWLGSDSVAYEVFMSQPKSKRQDEIEQYIEQYRSPAYRMGERRKSNVRDHLSRLPQGSLLDVGTGRGETLRLAAAAGHGPVHGTEVVPYLLSETVTYAEAHSLPFPDESFDHVTCFDVLEHLTEQDIAPALREMYRVARVSVTVSASSASDIRKGRELHISKRPANEWLRVIRSCWGAMTKNIGTAGASPAFQIMKPPSTQK